MPPSIQPTVRIAPLVVGDRMLPTDLLGYLLDPMQWDEQVAAVLAEREGIVLGVQHWTLIWFVREYFEQNQACQKRACCSRPCGPRWASSSPPAAICTSCSLTATVRSSARSPA